MASPSKQSAPMKIAQEIAQQLAVECALRDKERDELAALITSKLIEHYGPLIEVCDVQPTPGLDRITLFFQDIGVGKGRVILACWDNTWSCYFGAMGERTIKEFFLAADHEYLVNKLGISQVLKHGKKELSYLGRVIRAAKESLEKL